MKPPLHTIMQTLATKVSFSEVIMVAHGLLEDVSVIFCTGALIIGSYRLS